MCIRDSRNTDLNLSNIRCIWSVSYTHLDVYKRQILVIVTLNKIVYYSICLPVLIVHDDECSLLMLQTDVLLWMLLKWLYVLKFLQTSKICLSEVFNHCYKVGTHVIILYKCGNQNKYLWSEAPLGGHNNCLLYTSRCV